MKKVNLKVGTLNGGVGPLVPINSSEEDLKMPKEKVTIDKSMLELKKHDIQKARESVTTLYNDLKNVDHWEHKIYKSIFKYLEVLSTRLFYYDNATDIEIKEASKNNKKGGF